MDISWKREEDHSFWQCCKQPRSFIFLMCVSKLTLINHEVTLSFLKTGTLSFLYHCGRLNWSVRGPPPLRGVGSHDYQFTSSCIPLPTQFPEEGFVQNLCHLLPHWHLIKFLFCVINDVILPKLNSMTKMDVGSLSRHILININYYCTHFFLFLSQDLFFVSLTFCKKIDVLTDLK